MRRFSTCFFAFLLACAAGPTALTREEAAVLESILTEAGPRWLEGTPAGDERRRMAKTLKRLSRTLRKGSAEDVLEATADVRAAGLSPLPEALELVLSQAEIAARRADGVADAK